MVLSLLFFGTLQLGDYHSFMFTLTQGVDHIFPTLKWTMTELSWWRNGCHATDLNLVHLNHFDCKPKFLKVNDVKRPSRSTPALGKRQYPNDEWYCGATAPCFLTLHLFKPFNHDGSSNRIICNCFQEKTTNERQPHTIEGIQHEKI
jgi:hypothetical protein